jgi:hypothetical protein
VTPWLLALTLATGGELWAGTSGFDAVTCDSAALAKAIHTQRPATSVHPWRAGDTGGPPAAGIVVRLTRGEGGTVLEVTGAGAPIHRVLPATDTCERTVEIAAQIVDAALDDLRVEAAPQVESVLPPVPFRQKVELGVMLGGGVAQGAGSFSGALGGGIVGRYRFFELTFDASGGFPTTMSVTTSVPGATGSGTISVKQVALELGFGLAPRLGPGRGFVDIVGGVSLWFASFTSPPPPTSGNPPFFQVTSSSAEEGFVGARLGYALDLPLGLFVAARVEERLAPTKTTFGAVANTPTLNSSGATTPTGLTTPSFAFSGLGFVGYRFL